MTDGVLAFALSGLLSLLSIWIVFRPLSDWAVYPLAYTNTDDGLFNLYVIKTVIETGWYGSNPALGAPFVSQPFDFAKPETLHLLFYRTAGMFTGNVSLIHNLFYFAGFPLVAWSALIVLRSSLGLSWPMSIAGAQVYSWLPYHFMRIEHLFLSSYYVVPIGVWLMLKVCGDRPPFFERGRLGLASVWVWVAVALVGSTSLYYGFFTLLLLAGVAAVHSIVSRSPRVVTSAVLVALCLSGVMAINLAPSLAYRAREGANLVAAARSAGEADLYALKPLQLVLPYEGHRVHAMGGPARTYNDPRNENRYAALGLIGATGFVLLLLHALTGHRVLPDSRAVATLARANLLAVLIGMVGGLGALLALFAMPQFRALNRISVFIAFFSIAVVMTLVDRAFSRVGQGFSPADASPRALTLIATAVLLFVGFFDQVPATARPDTATIARAYHSDRAFVTNIERMLPPGSFVYQTPHTMFPEVRPFHREPSYSPMRLYLHSTALRWSYGGIKGRAGDNWHALLAQVPVRDRVATLRAAGFAGIVVDRRALAEGGHDAEQALSDLGLEGPLSSPDRTWTFYRISKTPSGDEDVLLLAVGGRGFYPVEGVYPRHWYWSNGPAELLIFNPFPHSRPIEAAFSLRSLASRQIDVQWPNGSRQGVTVGAKPVPVSSRMSVPPGWSVIRIDTDRPAAAPDGSSDRRRLAFMVSDIDCRSGARTR